MHGATTQMQGSNKLPSAGRNLCGAFGREADFAGGLRFRQTQKNRPEAVFLFADNEALICAR